MSTEIKPAVANVPTTAEEFRKSRGLVHVKELTIAEGDNAIHPDRLKKLGVNTQTHALQYIRNPNVFNKAQSGNRVAEIQTEVGEVEIVKDEHGAPCVLEDLLLVKYARGAKENFNENIESFAKETLDTFTRQGEDYEREIGERYDQLTKEARNAKMRANRDSIKEKSGYRSVTDFIGEHGEKAFEEYTASFQSDKPSRRDGVEVMKAIRDEMRQKSSKSISTGNVRFGNQKPTSLMTESERASRPARVGKK